MAKIILNNKEYNIDDAMLISATDELKNYFANAINGSGAKITLGGTEYNIDNVKLSTARNNLVTYLGTIAGSGAKVVIGGIEYGVDSTKVAGALGDLEVAFEDLVPDVLTMPAGLYETGAIALWHEGRTAEAEAMMVTSWEELEANGDMYISDGSLPEGAELSEYGFYYNAEYSITAEGVTIAFTFHQDGSAMVVSPNGVMELPAGVLVYGDHVIDMTAINFSVFVVSDDGFTLKQAESGAAIGMSSAAPKGTVCFGREPLPDMNEYGFYFGVVYTALIEGQTMQLVFNEDGSGAINGQALPAGSFGYSLNSIDMSSLDSGIAVVSNDGTSITIEDIGLTFTLSGGASYAPSGDLVLPDDGRVTSIAPSNFIHQPSLTGVVVPKSVASVGMDAFAYCTNLTTVIFSDNSSLTNMDEYAFQGCTNLKTVVFGNNSQLTIIPFWAFYKCSSLSSIVIPEIVTTIGCRAFSDCSSLTSITIPDSVISIDDSAFFGCSALTSITIPNSVKSIGENVFYNCTSLTSIAIPDGVTSIGARTFSNCTNLTSITIPNGVTSIGERAFYQCTNLASITIPNSVTEIDNDTFYGCTSLRSVIIPDSVTYIRASAFKKCSSLTSITIPDSVISIDWYAFQDCTSLTSIYFDGTKAQWRSVLRLSDWNKNVPATHVHCTDGDVAL